MKDKKKPSILNIILAVFAFICGPIGWIIGGMYFFFSWSKNNAIRDYQSQIDQKNEMIASLETAMAETEERIEKLGVATYEETMQKVSELNAQYNEKEKIIVTKDQKITDLNKKIDALKAEEEKLNKQVESQTKRVSKIKELYSAILYAINNESRLADADEEFSGELVPSISLKLHCMDSRELRKAYKDNDKIISERLEQYQARYTTKSNKTIYSLMVIALKAELQNILYNLKYEKLADAENQVKDVTEKYLKIVSEGNLNTAATIGKFIGEIEYLFINAVKIEYNYYVKREQAKQEQAAIREQMRQEAEERKALEAEKKKVEKEEEKYNTEINKLKEQTMSASDEELNKLNARILELQAQLAQVVVKKDEITALQNGKAGNIYIISNLGSFGENMFKIGMTRRQDPQDRVNELSDASVPFKFDVHSFIFSDDAVTLEHKIHTALNDKRVNKVNLRKEFFYSTVDELEQLVYKLDPTANFTKTMIAEEYRQSLSTDEIYSVTAEYDSFDEGDE